MGPSTNDLEFVINSRADGSPHGPGPLYRSLEPRQGAGAARPAVTKGMASSINAGTSAPPSLDAAEHSGVPWDPAPYRGLGYQASPWDTMSEFQGKKGGIRQIPSTPPHSKFPHGMPSVNGRTVHPPVSTAWAFRASPGSRAGADPVLPRLPLRQGCSHGRRDCLPPSGLHWKLLPSQRQLASPLHVLRTSHLGKQYGGSSKI